MRAPGCAAAALLLAAGAASAAVPASGPPFDLALPTPHRISFSIDTSAARDTLLLLSRSPEAPAALKRLKANRAFALGVGQGGASPDDFLGRLVSVAAGTADPLLSGLAARAESFDRILGAFETKGTPVANVEARRIAALLPNEPPISARLQLVPLLGMSGFEEVAVEPDGETIYLLADLPRLAGDGGVSGTDPFEALLTVLRSASGTAWRHLFESFARKGPGWAPEAEPGFDTFVARTVLEGPATLFLFPDEFFPLDSVLDEPIKKAFAQWNHAAERLLDPKTGAPARRDIVAEATRGDFWTRHAAIVGAVTADQIIRAAGGDAYLKALTAGPRSVATLYQTAVKVRRTPPFSKAVKKALEGKGPEPARAP